MLTIKEFAAQCQISPSWARKLVRSGAIRAGRTDGQYVIASEEAERWMAEHPNRTWVRNISHPNRPPVALGMADFMVLLCCGHGYNPYHAKAHERVARRVDWLRDRGITIELGWEDGTFPYYYLKDVVELDFVNGPVLLGPHHTCREEAQLPQPL